MTAEPEVCQELMSRIPRSIEGAHPEHAVLSICGRPVEADGLCAFHIRKRDAEPNLARKLRRLMHRRR